MKACPNVSMRTAYVDMLPKLMLVCTRDVEIGDEFLLNYGDNYSNAYIIGAAEREQKRVTDAEAHVDETWDSIAPVDTKAVGDY